MNVFGDGDAFELGPMMMISNKLLLPKYWQKDAVISGLSCLVAKVSSSPNMLATCYLCGFHHFVCYGKGSQVWESSGVIRLLWRSMDGIRIISQASGCIVNSSS